MCMIVYHEEYNKYDLGLDHPLIGDKPKKTLEFFKQKNLLSTIQVHNAPVATEEDLLLVHTQSYINHIKYLSKHGGMLAVDTPAPKGIYQYASRATGGTIYAGKKLFEEYHITMNPLGGFHHAGRETSSGFCFFNDIAIVTEKLRKQEKLKRIAIIDIDVHHCNGTQEIYYSDPEVLCISIHQDGRTLYPGTGALDKIGCNNGEGFTVNIPLPPGSGNQSFLYAFNEIVVPVIRDFLPELLIFQSGVDAHHTDPLADLEMTYPLYFTIGKIMKKLSVDTGNRLLVLFGGGYNSMACIYSYYNLCSALLGNAESIDEDERPDAKTVVVKDIVTSLKQVLSPYWIL